MKKVVFVPAVMEELGEWRVAKVGTGKTKKNWLGQVKEMTEAKNVWVTTGESDCKVNGGSTSDVINAVITEWGEEGYSLDSLTPITSGEKFFKTGILENTDGAIVFETKSHAGGWGYGYGFSYTSGFLLVFST
jgi:hypothetical protein